MGFSQAERSEQYVDNQLSKWIGAIPMLMPIFKRLNIAQIVNGHRPGKGQISHGTAVTVLALNRLLSPRPLVGGKRPVIIEMDWVFPAPLGPNRPKISPWLTRNEMPRTASKSPYFFSGPERPGLVRT